MANRLANETSPYLLQHADNPVDWHPWGDEALDKARRESKPILLSVGYSACHWCHVMAHESFEDRETADLMNRLFINIKVDREERPDLDKIYQLAHSALTRRGGGWPLTMFLTPEQVPFFGGTYFPKVPRHGMPAFPDILQKVADYLQSHPDDIERQNRSLLDFLATLERADHGAAAETGPLIGQAASDMETHFDAVNGGFGEPPKFPQVSTLELALRLGEETGQARLKHMAIFSLQKMAEGGLQDQLGGGFFRYSVDERWTIPHFEKMLYDNGLLLDCYARAWRVTGEPRFRQAAAGIAEWLLDAMRDPGGGFYAALDADSEGEEGRYYLWTPDEVRSILDESDYTLFAGTFGLDRPPNFEGRWHLRVCRNPTDLGAELDLNTKAVEEQLDRARLELLARRRQRVPPERDNKILAAWNALVIKGLTVAGMHCEQPEWIDAADAALGFVRQTLWNGRRLAAVHTAGETRLNGYLDDYAFLLDAVLHVLQARWDTQLLGFAQSLADVLLEQFHDTEGGGFFFTPADHESLIHRPKALADESTPAGAMVAARALQQLGHLTGETGYLDVAAASLESAKGAVQQVPLAHSTALAGLREQQNPPRQIILRGRRPAMDRWLQQARALCSPWTAVYAIDADAADLPGALAQKAARGECTAYICQGTQCSAPIDTPEAFAGALEQERQLRQ